MRLGEGAVFKAEKVKKNLLIIYAPLEGFLGLWEGAIFKGRKGKKKYIDNIRPPRGLLEGFLPGVFFVKNPSFFSSHSQERRRGGGG